MSTGPARLARRSPAEVRGARRHPVDAEALAAVDPILDDVQARGEAALRAHAERLGDLAPGAPLVIDRAALDAARDALPASDRAVLERTAARIGAFARAQRAALGNVELAVPGGQAGHRVAPVERAGCYAPGGRFPLPSSVLMTAVTARAAGVGTVWVASPRPAPITLAAASVAGADALLAAGGAQAIAAFAYGAGPVPSMDVIVGPGNRYVTAAKQRVAGLVGIDMLAGPSELVVLADGSADPATVASDLLAQAEHDPDALPVLVTVAPALVEAVEAQLSAQLDTLPTHGTARAALEHGFAVVCADLDEAVAVCDALAPEHLELLVEGAPALAPRLSNYGGLFVGHGAAEVLGDYGAGPNHVLPTGGASRHVGGLSVLHFLRVRTWLQLDDAAGAAALVDDAVQLARLEGLEGHARSAARRR
jgi:phosphoribosyl-ATP pyrophosphohydrolase/phosphoribosyl-AMP cyclohydrolase/histidinol dehydrogenase